MKMNVTRHSQKDCSQVGAACDSETIEKNHLDRHSSSSSVSFADLGWGLGASNPIEPPSPEFNQAKSECRYNEASSTSLIFTGSKLQQKSDSA